MQRENALAMHGSKKCGAKTRSGAPCRSPAMANGRCRMHGGAATGAPLGNSNALTHGLYTAETKAFRAETSALLRRARALLDGL